MSRCPSFILVDGSADKTPCSFDEGHLGCHSAWTPFGKVKWPNDLARDSSDGK